MANCFLCGCIGYMKCLANLMLTETTQLIGTFDIILRSYSQVKKYELPTAELMEKYEQIAGFHFVSSFTGQVSL